MKVYPTFFTSGINPLMAEGARASLFYMQPCLEIAQRLAGTTDATGKVTFSDIPQASKFDIKFDDERFAYPNYSKRISTSENQAQSDPVTFDLAIGATVSGKVKYGPDRKNASGIQVLVQPTNRGMSTANSGASRTDAEGNYRIAHLLPGEYNVVLHLQGDLQKNWTAAGHEWLKVESGQAVKGIDFSLIKGGIIKGKVITADTAEPIVTDIGVHGPAHPQSSSMIESVKTNADGEYSVRVPPGLQHVYISGMLPDAYRQPQQDTRDIKVDDGETTRLDFRLQRREGENVKGVVIGVDGKPSADVVVMTRSQQGRLGNSSANTDAQGRFHFDALPVDTTIEVKNGDIATAEPAVVRKGQAEIRLQLVRRVKLDLKGLITDEENKPIAGARVRLNQSFGNYGIGDPQPHMTGPDGRYEIKNLYADNQYGIAADADGFGESQAKLELKADTKELPTLKLPRASETTGGVVVDETGKPVAGVTVHLNNGMSPKTCVTDAQGKFSFAVVPGTNHLIWLAVKERGKVGPNANGKGGMNDLKLVLPKDEQ